MAAEVFFLEKSSQVPCISCLKIRSRKKDLEIRKVVFLLARQHSCGTGHPALGGRKVAGQQAGESSPTQGLDLALSHRWPLRHLSLEDSAASQLRLQHEMSYSKIQKSNSAPKPLGTERRGEVGGEGRRSHAWVRLT